MFQIRRPVNLPFQSIALITATSQISSLVFCLAWSIKFNFHESTATHCRVANFLPSLSATLDFTPQRDVWRSCIGLAGVPRFFIAYLYYTIIFKSRLLLFLHWLEVVALIGLSIVDSLRYFGKSLTVRRYTHQLLCHITDYLDDHPLLFAAFHATCVGIFLSTSIMHMALVCLEIVKCRDDRDGGPLLSRRLEKTRPVKIKIAITNFVAILTALYLYDRHNRYCEPGVYSMFSILEYIVIVANIVYHLQAYHDLRDYSLYVALDEENEKQRVSHKTKKRVQ